LIGRARGALFPIQWEEPFGLVMAEAMACGTPVIATRRGSVPEVVVDGERGFIRDSAAAMAEAVWATPRIDPSACRAVVEKRFSASRMVDGYLSVSSALGDVPLPEFAA
jgi:glycosyltransferase involved in cell wall biosynthesis